MIVNQLVGSLVGRYARPVLVVGGAPGAPEELKLLVDGGFDIENCLIVSANEHAIHLGLKPQFACVNDDVHHTLGTHQEPRLRELMPDVKLLSRHWWADYRSPQLLACNSGLKALLYAAILGANPVVVIGIQHYSNGLYFHKHPGSGGKNPNLDRGASYFAKQTKKLVTELQGVPIRPVSGPLTQLWPKWNPAETFEPRALTALEIEARDDAADTRYVCTTMAGFGFQQALVPKNIVFAVTRAEVFGIGHTNAVKEVTGTDLGDSALEQAQAESRAEHVRMQAMIHKLRSSRRGIRRTFYDADIVRLIGWVEGGQALPLVAGRIGLPIQQVQFMVDTMGVSARA